jgi:hypothetical protein
MAGLMAHVHHDLALILERIDRLFELSQLGIGEVERNAEDRLLVRTSPFVCQVADRTEFLEPASFELLVQLTDVPSTGEPSTLSPSSLTFFRERRESPGPGSRI